MQFSEKYELLNGKNIDIRIANVSDSEGIIDIWNSVVKERIFTMGLNYFNVDDEINFLKSLDEREAILVAVLNGIIIGYSLIKIPDIGSKSTLHAAEIGTWVIKEYRGLGVGSFLLDSVFKFTKMNNFEKLVIKVRSSNRNALNFYRKHGFEEIGRFRRQIKIDSGYEDHVLMEKFLI